MNKEVLVATANVRRSAFAGVAVLLVSLSACATAKHSSPPTRSPAPPAAAPTGGVMRGSGASLGPSAGAPQGPGQLSPAMLAEIGALLQDKAARTPVQRRIDSQLLYARQIAEGHPVIPTLEAHTTRAADGRELLDVRADVSTALVNQIRALGADVLDADTPGRTIRVQARLDLVEQIAALTGVQFVGPEPQWQTLSLAADAASRAREAGRSAVADALPIALPIVLTGSVTSEGDATHRAAQARSTYGVYGAGVKIGVLSGSVTNTQLFNSRTSGNVDHVEILPGQAGGTNSADRRGGANAIGLLEIIHDLAPSAELYFATGTTSPVSFANNIRALAAAGCQILVDDVYWAGESPFQDGQGASVSSTTNGGVIKQAVKDVAEAGVLYFSAAGDHINYVDPAGRPSSTWEGDFVDGGTVTYPEFPGKSYRIHSFGNSNYASIYRRTSNLGTELFWSDPLGQSANDYDLFKGGSDHVSLASTNVQTGTQDPYERLIGPQTSGSTIVIVKYSGSARFLHLSANDAWLTPNTPGETHGHAATSSANAIGVAATAAGSPGPYPGAFSSSNTVEIYSSDGPRRIFFAGDGVPFTPGNFSSTGGRVLNKPDITAADAVSASQTSPVNGTSAAAAHAAAIAALVKSFKPALTAGQIRSTLVGSAIDIESAGYDRYSGAGIIMADTALALAATAALFSDDPLAAGLSPVKGLHITELRGYVDTLRARNQLTPASWSESIAAGATTLKASHILELRAALAGVYTAAGVAQPSYTSISQGSSLLKAVYITELRAAVTALY